MTTLKPIAQPLSSVDSLDVALVQSEKRIREGEQEISDLSIEFVFNLGQKFHSLKEEEKNLEKEVILRQRRIDLLPRLHQEQWLAHLLGTKERLKLLAGKIAVFFPSMTEFRSIFPNEAVSKIQDHAIPDPKWLKVIGDFVVHFSNPAPRQDQESEQKSITVSVNHSLAAVIDFPKILELKKQVQGLEERIATLKNRVHVLERQQTILEEHNLRVIESWNKVFMPYLNMVHSCQKTISLYLEHQETAFTKLSQEFVAIHIKLTTPGYLISPPDWRLAVEESNKEIRFPSEAQVAMRKIDKARLLKTQVDSIVQQFDGMIFKTNITKE